ncbi:hypothetical protein PTKIN_Ptkin02bG0188700 [Pterospermum kingtungense]
MASPAAFLSSSLFSNQNYLLLSPTRASAKGYSNNLRVSISPSVISRTRNSVRLQGLVAMQEKGASALGDDSKMNKIPHVLTVAGSDSGAGAGIQADLKACAARRVYCSTVITAVTAQNTVGVQGVSIVPEDFVADQLNSVLSDMQVDVVKTGMLPSVGIVKILCKTLRQFPVQALVVDPVMVSTSGDVLAGPSILSTFKEELLPMADIITPNLKEASALLDGRPLETVDDMRSAARLLHNMGTNLASCIAAELAKGYPVLSAVKVAKRFIETALDYSKEIVIGNGPQGPFDHLLKLKSHSQDGHRPQLFNPSDLFLYAVTDSRMNKRWGRSITDAVKTAIEGGATIVQLREKDIETKDFLESAKACLKICRWHGVPLLINDRVDVAIACDADGVHVGQSDMPAHVARTLLGPEKIIGVSCKTPEQAQQAWIDGADYIGCGGVYPTNTKENNITVGLDGLKTVCMACKLPVVAIGGIGTSNAQAVMEIGAPNLKGVVVVSALFDRECILTETRKLHAILSESNITDTDKSVVRV